MHSTLFIGWFEKYNDILYNMTWYGMIWHCNVKPYFNCQAAMQGLPYSWNGISVLYIMSDLAMTQALAHMFTYNSCLNPHPWTQNERTMIQFGSQGATVCSENGNWNIVMGLLAISLALGGSLQDSDFSIWRRGRRENYTYIIVIPTRHHHGWHVRQLLIILNKN